jgi:hypothetical protein
MSRLHREQQSFLSTTRHLIEPESNRRGRRRICFLHGLADIELESIMHFLDYKSLLALARCSRRLHVSAGTPFAWKYHPAYEVTLSDEDPNLDGARLARSLLRHVSVHLQMEVGCKAIETMLTWGQFANRPIRAVLLAPLLQHPTVLQRVHTLQLQGSRIPSTLAALSTAAHAGCRR